MNMLRESLRDVHHGIGLAVLALILGALWAAYMATHHEQLHGGFEKQEAAQKETSMQQMDMKGMSLGSVSNLMVPSAHAHGGEAHGAGGGHADEEAAAGGHQHSHSGSLAMDAMQRLLRGHIHFMGIGMLAIVMLILVASTALKGCWKKVFGWTFGLGALLYPPAWILMGFRTVELGPQAAEASVLWLFGPAVALLIGSLIALFSVLAIECLGLKKSPLFSWAFTTDPS
ncbi:MAG: hypothetical protein R8J84_00230 [Mariprofundales bacterium]